MKLYRRPIWYSNSTKLQQCRGLLISAETSRHKCHSLNCTAKSVHSRHNYNIRNTTYQPSILTTPVANRPSFRGLRMFSSSNAAPDELAMRQREQRLEKSRKWLRATDYNSEGSEYRKHLKNRVPHTGAWLFETKEFKSWFDTTEYGALWIKAIAGAGKSVLAASVISNFNETTDMPVLFFFFRQIISANHDSHGLVRDWLAQLVEHSPELLTKLQKMMGEQQDSRTIALDELWQLLVDSLVSMPKVCCVIDALDEMNLEQIDFLKRLVDLGSLKPDSIKLIMTSRPLPHIHAVLNTPSILPLRMDQEQMNKDIAVYIDHRLSTATGLPLETRDAIRKATEKQAHPSFLYARLMLDRLLKEPESLDLESTEHLLASLPTNLEQMYTRMLEEHSRRVGISQERQLLIVQWVTHAIRPLRLLEFATLLEYLGVFNEDETSKTKEAVRKSCGPLLEILDDETVSVIHHSFTEFLINQDRDDYIEGGAQFPIISPMATHNLLASTCLKFLTSGIFTESQDKEASGTTLDDYDDKDPVNDVIRTLQARYLFLSYALNNWFKHVERLHELDETLIHQLDDFMSAGSKPFKIWFRVTMTGKIFDDCSILHVAAWTGMTSYAKYLIETGSGIDKLDNEGQTPLILAAKQGHTNCVALLLTRGSKIDLGDRTNTTAIHHAARGNHHKIVRLLLEAGADPMATTNESPSPRDQSKKVGKTALEYACKAGSLESICEMLPYLNRDNVNSALYWSASSGHFKIVQHLLAETSVDVNALHEGVTAIIAATRGLHNDVVELLLKNGADPNIRCKDESSGGFAWHVTDNGIGCTSIHALIGDGRSTYEKRYQKEKLRACLQLLIKAGCDINALDGRGRTILHYSVEEDLPITVILVDNGADVHKVDNIGQTPLHGLRYHDHFMDWSEVDRMKEVLEKLVSHGARVDAARDFDGGTPLHLAILQGQNPQLDMWKPFVNDWNITSSSGNTPLHLLLRNSNRMLQSDDMFKHVTKLLEFGADPTRRNVKGQTPLHLFKGRCDEKLLEKLIGAGCDINATDHDGYTLLMYHMKNDEFKKSYSTLLKAGARLDIRDIKGNTLFHMATKTRNPCEIFDILLQGGLDPTALNLSGETALHVLLKNQGLTSVESIRWLLEAGVDGTKQDYEGRTPIHNLCAYVSRREASNKIQAALETGLISAINTPDFRNVFPIHLAVSASEKLMVSLIQKGADVTVKTAQQRNLLHVAAQCRQTNHIGLILDSCLPDQKLSLVNQQDARGRTPLHEACRSGKLESVLVLLKAGGDVTIKDKKGRTPLHACAELVEEQGLWKTDWLKRDNRPFNGFCISPEDHVRPSVYDLEGFTLYGQAGDKKVWNEIQNPRVTEIIDLLLAYGADYDAVDKEGCSPLALASQLKSDEMVAVLRPVVEREAKRSHSGKPSDGRNLFEEEYLMIRRRNIGPLLEQRIKEGDDIQELCHRLLVNNNFEGLSFLASSGFFKYVPDEIDGSSVSENLSFIRTLVQFGYTKVLEVFGQAIDQGWMEGTAEPYLLTAAKRTLPNLHMIKMMTERLSADINIVRGQGVLHILAAGQHWWQTSAIEYLVERGADVNMRNEKGQTPLHICLFHQGYRKMETAQLLLRLGATANLMDNNGATPLNMATSDSKLLKLLMDHGADIEYGEQSLLGSAIAAQNGELVQTLLDCGLNLNEPIRLDQPLTLQHYRNRWSYEENVEIEMNDIFPLHYAAHHSFNGASIRKTTIPIIEVLLNHGADPYLPCIDDTTILHSLMKDSGIIEPFIDLPGIDIEKKDGKGRTLLLAACLCSTRVNTDPDSYPDKDKPQNITRAQLMLEKNADPTAVDHDGNNAIHLLIYAHSTDENIFKLLLEKCPDLLHQRNRAGLTPLQLAAKNGHILSIPILLDAGADAIEPEPESGNTVLHYLACLIIQDERPNQGKAKEYLKRVCELGGNINARNNQGETPIFSFFRRIENCDYEWLKPLHSWELDTLIKAGADPLAINNANETLLHVVAGTEVDEDMANQNDVTESFKDLLKLGLDPLVEDNKQRTAIDIAAAYNNKELLQLFKKKGDEAEDGSKDGPENDSDEY